MSDELLTQLTRISLAEQMVASNHIGEGLNLLVYPMVSGVIVGLGYEREEAHRMTAIELLRRRSRALPRYGQWLPTSFRDGGLYVVRKVDGLEHEQVQMQVASLSGALQSARELLT